jgi:hypothetical protein
MAQFDLFLPPKRPWNTGRIIGPKDPPSLRRFNFVPTKR